MPLRGATATTLCPSLKLASFHGTRFYPVHGPGVLLCHFEGRQDSEKTRTQDSDTRLGHKTCYRFFSARRGCDRCPYEGGRDPGRHQESARPAAVLVSYVHPSQGARVCRYAGWPTGVAEYVDPSWRHGIVRISLFMLQGTQEVPQEVPQEDSRRRSPSQYLSVYKVACCGPEVIMVKTGHSTIMV